MAIGNLSNKISSSDVNKIKDKRNPPEFEPGFEGDGGFDLDSIFDDLESEFGTPTSGGGLGDTGSTFGQPAQQGFGTFGQPAQQGLGTFGQPAQQGMGTLGQPAMGGMGQFGQPMGMPTQKPKERKPDALDKAMDFSGAGLTAIGRILVDLVKSTRNRNADDWGYYSRNLIITGLVVGGTSLVLSVLGTLGDVGALKFSKIPLQMLASGIMSVGSGLIGISLSALRIVSKHGEFGESNVESLPEIQQDFSTSEDNNEDDIDSILGDLFSDLGDGEDLYEDEDDYEDSGEVSNFEYGTEAKEVNFKEVVGNVQGNVPLITREVLINTFKQFLPTHTPRFADKVEIEYDTDEFYNLETLALKALAAAKKVEFEEVGSELERAYETFFCYELRMKRVKGLNKLDEIEREMTAYFRESSTDLSVSSTVDIEGDFYKIVINKGISAIVTIGDVIRLAEAYDFFMDSKNRLPVLSGILEDGTPLLVDAKTFDTLLIAGKPRGGKSWSALCVLISLIISNTPEDVQLLIIDPKESNLFKTMALLPHVCGLHDDRQILRVLEDVIEYEAPRRKKLLADNKCDDIWALRERKGIRLPILYIVIDEVMSVISNLGDKNDEFTRQLKTIITQFPSLGIKLILVPHRALGVVDKTVRTNIGFSAAVRADDQIIKETLDITKWNKPLVNVGDAAVKIQGIAKELFVRSAAVTKSDAENTELIESIARAYYKMGVDIPDMSTMGYGYNRNEELIRKEIQLNNDSNRVQFDINDTSDISFDDLFEEEE